MLTMSDLVETHERTRDMAPTDFQNEGQLSGIYTIHLMPGSRLSNTSFTGSRSFRGL